ncbi:hypothetical protein HT667_06325 [Ursidibacter maritimus]|uniref:hypothetical protein n=1 Tax=Ursidibacter maritimus TaxID=1331689 RepID=UPI001C473681|nr:hypothetical protein [Ursidibacter maritimus]MBV6541068.1 hypothetical protein [Ursidibacter maritimus]
MGSDISDYRLVIEPEITELLAQQNQLLDKQNQVFDKLNGTLSNLSNTELLSQQNTLLEKLIDLLGGKLNTVVNQYECSTTSFIIEYAPLFKPTFVWIGLLFFVIGLLLVLSHFCLKNKYKEHKCLILLPLLGISLIYSLLDKSVLNIDDKYCGFRLELLLLHLGGAILVLIVLPQMLKFAEGRDTNTTQNQEAVSSTDQLNKPE